MTALLLLRLLDTTTVAVIIATGVDSREGWQGFERRGNVGNHCDGFAADYRVFDVSLEMRLTMVMVVVMVTVMGLMAMAMELLETMVITLMGLAMVMVKGLMAMNLPHQTTESSVSH